MQIQIDVNQDQFKQLIKELGEFRNKLPRQLRTIVSKVGKTVRVQVAKKLGQVMYLKSNDGKAKDGIAFQKAETLKKVIKRKQAPTVEKPTVILRFDEGYPFPLKYYNARPYIKREKGKKQLMGVHWNHKPVNYKNKGTFKGTVTDAFIVARYGNNVYRRNEGRRLVRVLGPAPGDYFEQIGAARLASGVAQDRLPKEVKRRIREIILEKQGIIQLKTSRGR
jgi:hypothetical protein